MRQKIQNNMFARGPMNLLLIACSLVVVLFFLTQLTNYTRDVKVMNYSTFMKAIEQDQVANVHIAGQDVSGRLKDGTRFEATIAENPHNYELLRAHNVDFSVEQTSTQGSIWYFLLLFLVLGLPFVIWHMLRQAKNSGGPGGIFNIGKSRARVFMPSMVNISFDSVAGAHAAKQAFSDVVDFLKNPQKYKKLGAKVPRGILLVGEPGNGKTLLAKAIAGQANCPFFTISGSDFMEVFVGVGAARVRDLFAQARKHEPSIIFIDEIDAIGRSRGSGFGGGHDEREQTLNQLLTEMDGFETSNSAVIVIAATNMPDVLDKALLRPGRFDRLVTVEYPDLQSREHILKINASKKQLASDVELKNIALETAGFSGADLASLMNEAAIIASKKNQDEITMSDLWQSHKIVLESKKNSGESSGSLGIGRQGSSKPKLFMPTQVNTKFSDVAGIPEAKQELQEIIEYLKNPTQFTRLGARMTKGVLLVGDPGNGKTLLARAIAGEANCPFFSVSGSDFVEMYVGVGASRVRELFTQARRHMPSIIFVDEIDAIGGQRTPNNEGGSAEYAQTLNQLLTEMDGFNSKDSSIIVIAATNRKDMLDKALLRPGRFDKVVTVPYPTALGRKEILEVHTKNVKLDESIDLMRIAQSTRGFSGADLANMINLAALIATKREEAQSVSLNDLEEARDRITIGQRTPSILPSCTERDFEIAAYHEAGHALMRVLQEEAYPLDKVTIGPRGHTLGVTHGIEDRERPLLTEKQMLAEINVAMGGRVAELLIFNQKTTGAGADFKTATQRAQQMVRLCGMTDEIGPVVHDGSFAISQKTQDAIDETVKKILTDSEKYVAQVLTKHREKLDSLSQALLEKETLYADEVYALFGMKPREIFRLDKVVKGDDNGQA